MAERPGGRDTSLDYLIIGPVLMLSAMTCAIIWAIKGELLLHSLTALVLVLVYYLFLPLRLKWALSVSLVFSVFFVLSASFFLDIMPDEFIQVILYLTLANVLGALVSRERNTTLRHEYLVVESERQTADDRSSRAPDPGLMCEGPSRPCRRVMTSMREPLNGGS